MLIHAPKGKVNVRALADLCDGCTIDANFAAYNLRGVLIAATERNMTLYISGIIPSGISYYVLNPSRDDSDLYIPEGYQHLIDILPCLLNFFYLLKQEIVSVSSVRRKTISEYIRLSPHIAHTDRIPHVQILNLLKSYD